MSGARNARQILESRAAALARPAPGAAAADLFDVVEFSLASERYAVEVVHVREVYPLRSLTPVPCTPAFVLGIISVRGEICAVMDLREVFGLPAQGLTNATRAVILRSPDMQFGILADTVLGVRPVPASSLAAAPDGKPVSFVRGIAPDGLIVLDAAALLAHPSMRINEEVEA